MKKAAMSGEISKLLSDVAGSSEKCEISIANDESEIL